MSHRTTFRKWFSTLDGPIIAARFYPYDAYWSSKPNPWPNHLAERLLEPHELGPFLDIEFSTDFGTQDCPSFSLWTPSSVYFVHEYDGSVWLSFQPRNPT